MWTDNILFDPVSIVDWGGIYQSQDLVSLGQHDLLIRALNKINTHPSFMRYVSYLGVNGYFTGINLVITITLRCSSFSVGSTQVYHTHQGIQLI